MLLMTVVNNPGDWDNVYAPLLHAEWHGYTPTDMVFPFFVFIMGVAMPFGGESNWSWQKVLSRTLRIFCLGFFLAFFSKIEIGSLEGIPLMVVRLIITIIIAYLLLGNFSTKIKLYTSLGLFISMILLAYSGLDSFNSVRIPGVLQRISLVYFFVVIINHFLSLRAQIILGVALLLGYWAIMALVAIEGYAPGSFAKGNNVAAWLDNLLLPGHLYSATKTWDPEGILSTLPAIVTGLLGLWTGKLLLEKNENNFYILCGLGLGLLILGKIWGIWFPINKALWTSSYVLFVGGWAILILMFIQLFWSPNVVPKAISSFFNMWGVNPMIVFFMSGIIPRVLGMIKWGPENEGTITYIFKHFISPLTQDPKLASLMGALIYVLIWSVILLIFKKKNLIFKV